MFKKLLTVILCSCALLTNASIPAKPMATETPDIANGTGDTWQDNANNCTGITLPMTIKGNTNFEDNAISVDASKWDKKVCPVVYHDISDFKPSATIQIILDDSVIGWHVVGYYSAHNIGNNNINIFYYMK